MVFAVIWMDLGIIMLKSSKSDRQRQIYHLNVE